MGDVYPSKNHICRKSSMYEGLKEVRFDENSLRVKFSNQLCEVSVA